MATGRSRVPQGSRVHPAHEVPSPDYPLRYTTGRTVYQFHTRTKTGRSRSLDDAAPDAWVELSPSTPNRSASSKATGSASSRLAEPSRCAARLGRVMAGAVFAPFHYGHCDPDKDRTHRRRSPRGQRADDDRVGTSLQAALLQDRRLPGDPVRGRRRPRAGSHQHGLGS